MIAATRSGVSVSESVLFVGLELGKQQWKVAMTSGFGIAPLLKTVASGDWRGLEAAFAWGRQRLGMAADGRIVSCYEAGRDGFWIHRALVSRRVENRVVDSSSIEVNRRRRRTKTDRIDALKLVMMLVRVCLGEPQVWREVRVPAASDEAARHISRERQALVAERTRLINQVRSWLATLGAAVPRQQPAGWWTRVRDWAGAELPAPVQARLARAHERLAVLTAQIAALQTEQRAAIATAGAASAGARLLQLKGIGATSVSVLLDEGLVWRRFENRRQLGALLGFAPTRYESGESSRDQGISRAGNPRLQSVMVELAWSWLKWQPHSALTRWYLARFGTGKRARKVGIVALARKLLIALWRWVTQGVEPENAILQAA
jgi:transposase